MNKTLITILTLGAALLIIILVLFGMYASYNNQEVSLRAAIEAKQKDNENVYDNMWKSVKEVGNIPDHERDKAIEMFKSYADARTPDSGGQFATFVKESIPNADPTLYKNLMNTITSLRADFKANQTRLLDLSRERNALVGKIPSKWFISNNEPIDVTIVTSTRTSRAFSEGKDDETFDINPAPKTVE